MEVIEAEIAIRTGQRHLQAWPVDSEDLYTGVIPALHSLMRFTIGKEFSRFYYPIEAQ